MNISASNTLDCTLEDGRWKDSFDKLLDEKPVLSELNVLKKHVRASYNNDSSIENSRDVPGSSKKTKRIKTITRTISTPVGKRLKHPFKCKISPINARTSKALFKLNNTSRKCHQRNGSKYLQSTILHPSTVVVEYNSIKQTSSKNSNQEDSLEILLTHPKKVGKLTRVRSCNVIGKNLESVANVKSTTQPKESNERRIGVKVAVKNINKESSNSQTVDTVGGKILRKRSSSQAVIQNVKKKTLKRLTKPQPICKSIVFQNTEKVTSASNEQVCLNTLNSATKGNVDCSEAQNENFTADKQQSKESSVKANSEISPADINCITDNVNSKQQNGCSAEHYLKNAGPPAGLSIDPIDFNSKNRNSEITDCSLEVNAESDKRLDSINKDALVTVRKSRTTSRESSGLVIDKINNISTTLTVVNKGIATPIERLQTTRRTENAMSENVKEFEKLPIQNEILLQNGENCRISNALSDTDATRQRILRPSVVTLSESPLNRELVNANNDCNSNQTQSNTQNDDNLKTLANNIEILKNQQRRSNRRALRSTNPRSTGYFNEATFVKTRNVECLHEKIQASKEPRTESKISDTMVTVRKSNNCPKSLPQHINDDGSTEKIESNQRRSNRLTSRKSKTDLYENLLGAVSLTNKNIASINESMVVFVENNLETSLAPSSAIVAARQIYSISNDIPIHISDDDDDCTEDGGNNAEAVSHSLEKPVSSCSKQLLKNSKNSTTEITAWTAARGRMSNPMITVRKRNSVRRNTGTETLKLANIETVIEEGSSTEQVIVCTDQFTSKQNMAVSSVVTEEPRKKQVGNSIVERRRNHIKRTSENDKTKTSSALNSRSYGRTLSSVQEVVNESEHSEPNTFQMTNKTNSVEELVQRKPSKVKFIDVPCKSPTKQGQTSDNARNNDSDVVFVEANEHTNQAQNFEIMNRRVSKRSAVRVQTSDEHILSPQKSANHNKSVNKFISEDISRHLTLNLNLQPGKWRKSLSVLRRSQMNQAQNRQSCYRHINNLESIIDNDDMDQSVEYIGNSTFVGNRKAILIKPEKITLSQQSFVHLTNYKERVLRYCNQKSPLSFDALYAKEAMQSCTKIGEGVYGEVFMKKVENALVVCKIIPIEGSVLVNGEVQKTFEQILPEIVISKELAMLKETASSNSTPGFVDLKKVACVEGKYPQHLIKCWEAYDNEKSSENDHPEDFPEKQLYIVLELEYAGKDLESFVFNNAEQSYAALLQVVVTLAVAEEALEFEHRDLHWGNVLIRQTSDTELQYKLSGETLTVPTKGIEATIIDYTLSRMKYDNHCFYNDLAKDEELFTATGDYQFDIYRMMRDVLSSKWERFEPKTNVFWLSYLISKIENGVKYKNGRSKTHTQHLHKISSLKDHILDFDSACSFAKYMLSQS